MRVIAVARAAKRPIRCFLCRAMCSSHAGAEGASSDGVVKFAAAADREPALFMKLAQSLSPTGVEAMHGAALSSMGPETAQRAFAAADANADGQISLPEFKGWVASSRRRFERSVGASAGGAAAAVPRPSNRQLVHVALRSGVPFIGFGFLDNAIMLVAGDRIDGTLGAAMGISVLAAAGLGNLVSDVAGIGLSSSIERFSGRLGLPDPRLSAPQAQLGVVHRAASAGSALGIAVGCILGLLPLLFLGGASEERERSAHKVVHSRAFVAAAATAFARLDVNESGRLETKELLAAFEKLQAAHANDLPCLVAVPSEAEAAALARRYSKKGADALDLPEFLDLVRDLYTATINGASLE